MTDSRFFDEAVLRERRRTRPALPWEQGWVGRALGTTSSRWYDRLVAPARPNPPPVAGSSHGQHERAPKRRRETFHIMDEDQAREKVLAGWVALLLSEPSCSGTLTKLDADDRAEVTIRSILAPKATSTLQKRLASLQHYVRWAQSVDVQHPLQGSASVVEMYVENLIADGGSASAPESFRNSVNFFNGLFEGTLGGGQPSAALRGMCIKHLRNKEALKQAPALTVGMLKKLEELTCTHSSLYLRVVAGYLCFCAYASSRFGDGQDLGQLDFDLDKQGKGVIIGASQTHKTSRTITHTRRLLPLMALGQGLHEQSWALAWKEAREELGLRVPQYPCLPEMNNMGDIKKVKVSTSRGSVLLRDLLADSGLDEALVRPLTSHSLKATILSWCAKWGLPLETRRILGHHVDPGAKSVITYSRDALVAAHTSVAKMINAIKLNKFDPDTTPGERIRLIDLVSEDLEASAGNETRECPTRVPLLLPRHLLHLRPLPLRALVLTLRCQVRVRTRTTSRSPRSSISTTASLLQTTSLLTRTQALCTAHLAGIGPFAARASPSFSSRFPAERSWFATCVQGASRWVGARLG